MMNTSVVIFYILGIIILGGALLSVTARKIFRSAVYLLFSLLGVAGFYFYFNYEFLGAVQVVVYVGGIVVLLIFSIFLTADSDKDLIRTPFKRNLFSALAATFAFALTLIFIIEQLFTPKTFPIVEPSVKNIGRQMLSTTSHGYILPFETVSILLLVAMIGCIVIAMKEKPKA